MKSNNLVQFRKSSSTKIQAGFPLAECHCGNFFEIGNPRWLIPDRHRDVIYVLPVIGNSTFAST